MCLVHNRIRGIGPWLTRGAAGPQEDTCCWSEEGHVPLVHRRTRSASPTLSVGSPDTSRHVNASIVRTHFLLLHQHQQKILGKITPTRRPFGIATSFHLDPSPSFFWAGAKEAAKG